MTHRTPLAAHVANVAILAFVAMTLTAHAGQAPARYTGWSHSGSFYIITTPEGANLPASAAENDFPLLVRLHKDFFDFSQAKAHGEDIRFSTATGTPLAVLQAAFEEPQPCAGLRAVPFNQVKIEDAFWSPRLDTVQKVTLPDMLDLAETQGKIDNFAIVAGRKPGKITLANCPDSDVYKLLEAAAYTLAWRRDPVLEKRIDDIIELIAAAQDKDGYLNTQYALPLEHPASPPADAPHVKRFSYGSVDRWKGTFASWPKGEGQMYCAGHLFEAAVAYYRATGKRVLLDAAVKFADHVYRRFPPGQPIDYADHPQIEIGLMKLFEVTGDRRYLELANHLARNVNFARPRDLGDGENRKPLAEQRKAWGHAVRINYIYSGATDVCRYSDQPDLREALDSLWHSIVDRRIYVHGGVGGPAAAEQLADDWILDPAGTYSECCANIAHGQWNHALNLLQADARYADLVEIEAYNGGLAGISLDGNKFFYANNLTAGITGRKNKKSGVREHYLFCCPSKVPGFLGGISRWVAAQDDRGIYLNLYVGGTIEVTRPTQKVTLRQQTQYPWDGQVRVIVTPEKPGEFDLCLRIPGWAQGRLMPSDLYRFDKAEPVKWTVTVNGVPLSAGPLEKGYLRLRRAWKAGDVVDLDLPMSVRRVYSHENVTFTRGCTALYRGPLLYCLEGVDNPGFSVLSMVLPAEAEVRAERRADLLGGVTVLRGKGLVDGNKPAEFTAIPYYAWQNRGIHEMTAWLIEDPQLLTSRDGDGPLCTPDPAKTIPGPASLLDPPPQHGVREVDHARVDLRGGFWGPRLKTHHEVTVPHGLDCLEKDGHVTNFDKAVGVLKGPPSGHAAFDSDLHKALEGAMYSLQHYSDIVLRNRSEGILDHILAAQQKDGFLISYFIIQDSDKRWDDMRIMHQLYNAGHFFEMAVEHHRLTGQPRVLDAAKRFADHIDGVFGPGKRYDVPGHQEIELALVKLYRATGERRYLELAKFFLDERGYAHGTERKPFDPSTAVQAPIPEGLSDEDKRRESRRARNRVRNGRMQDHKPVVEQFEAVGHAVRAGYLYTAMADVVRFSDAPDYERALDRIWDDVVSRKMYVTGGIGTAQYGDEGFGDPYLLPNGTAYCESCAAIAHVLWQHRMTLLKAEARYADVMELALYNSVLSGISLSGDQFFYQNPLASKGGGRRSSWIGLSCCPTNLMRIIPQVGGLVYATTNGRLYVNLYAAGEAAIKRNGGGTVTLAQQTDYPWDGRVRLTVTPDEAAEFTLCLRIPGWATGRPVPSDLYRFAEAEVPPVALAVNGKKMDPATEDDGYVHLSRRWQPGDVVELDLPMPVHRVYAHERVESDRGKVALMRGPIVYCLEGVDHPDVDLFKVSLPPRAELAAEHRSDLLGGVTVIRGEGAAAEGSPVPLTAIPYYAWQNRGRSAMTVWLNDR